MEDFNRFDELFQEIDQKVNQTVRKTAFDAERIAKQLSRVDTGDMRNEWYVRTEDSSDRGSVRPDSFPEVAAPEHNEALLVGGSAHTIYNEYGTRYMAAQPMATPAIEQVRQPFFDALKAIEGLG